MKNSYTSEWIMSKMDEILQDPQHQSIFSSSGTLEKLAFTRVADEDKPTELEVEFAIEMENSTVKTASDKSPKADCVACGKTRANWKEEDGVCKCATSSGCSPLTGCKDNCSCACKTKKAGNTMDTLIKSAFDSLMSASSDLDAAGLESLAADTLVLMNELIVEAKAKKDPKLKAKLDKAKAEAKEKKEKLKALKEKAKAKAEAEKAKEEAKAKAEKDKNEARDKAMKLKEKKEKAEKAEKVEKLKKKVKSASLKSDLPKNFDQILNSFLRKRKSFEAAGELNMFNEDILGIMESEARGEDEESFNTYYPDWTHEDLFHLLHVLRNVGKGHNVQ